MGILIFASTIGHYRTRGRGLDHLVWRTPASIDLCSIGAGVRTTRVNHATFIGEAGVGFIS